MPTVIDGRVGLDQKERELIEDLVGESINPKTIDEFNAWIDLAAEERPGDDADRLLLREVASSLRINDGQRPSVNWKAGEHDESAEVISVDFKKPEANK